MNEWMDEWWILYLFAFLIRMLMRNERRKECLFVWDDEGRMYG